MNRREFLKYSGLLLMMSRFLGGRAAAAAGPSIVAVAEGKDYGAVTKRAVDAVGGIGRFVKAGNTVVVKPNMGWDRRPEQAATTHPAVVRAIVEECVKAGAKRVRVFDNPCNDMRRCYEDSGIQAALKGMKNVEVRYIEDERYKKVKIKGTFLKEWEIYGDALSADVIINVPIAKHHSLTQVTLALKNMMGVMGGDRGYIHRQIEDALADLNSIGKEPPRRDRRDAHPHGPRPDGRQPRRREGPEQGDRIDGHRRGRRLRDGAVRTEAARHTDNRDGPQEGPRRDRPRQDKDSARLKGRAQGRHEAEALADLPNPLPRLFPRPLRDHGLQGQGRDIRCDERLLQDGPPRRGEPSFVREDVYLPSAPRPPGAPLLAGPRQVFLRLDVPAGDGHRPRRRMGAQEQAAFLSERQAQVLRAFHHPLRRPLQHEPRGHPRPYGHPRPLPYLRILPALRLSGEVGLGRALPGHGGRAGLSGARLRVAERLCPPLQRHLLPPGARLAPLLRRRPFPGEVRAEELVQEPLPGRRAPRSARPLCALQEDTPQALHRLRRSARNAARLPSRATTT